MRRLKLLSAARVPLAVIWLSVATLVAFAADDATSDPLPAWNDAPAKRAILDFVRAAVDEQDPRHVPPAERIATFDQDGTLWVEQPVYTQLVFAFDRVRDLAPEHPVWKTEEPFKSILDGTNRSLVSFTSPQFERLVAETHSGMTIDEFHAIVNRWLATARHPRFKRPYTELVYRPMLELMRYLRDQGFQVYIVTGGGQEFVRAYAQRVYGLGPERVIGTMTATEYAYAADGRPQLRKLPQTILNNNAGGKPQGINLVIGRHPRAAFGNSTGDRQMLEWTQAAGKLTLMMLVHHDDAAREYAYGPDSPVGTFSTALMDEAQERGWTVISMKRDWKRIFAFEEKVEIAPRADQR